MSDKNKILESIRELVKNNRTKEALDEVHYLANGSNQMNTAILQSSRYKALLEYEMKGIMDQKTQLIEYSLLNDSIGRKPNCRLGRRFDAHLRTDELPEFSFFAAPKNGPDV